MRRRLRSLFPGNPRSNAHLSIIHSVWARIAGESLHQCQLFAIRSLLTGLRDSSIVPKAEIAGIHGKDLAKPDMEPATEISGQPSLLRVLGLWDTTAIVMGIMIGSAIFIVPAEITREVGSERAALCVWVISGLLSLFGALSFAELAAMLPQAGGQYIYLREAYGHLVSFLCGWTFFLAVQSGGISTVAARLHRQEESPAA